MACQEIEVKRGMGRYANLLRDNRNDRPFRGLPALVLMHCHGKPRAGTCSAPKRPEVSSRVPRGSRQRRGKLRAARRGRLPAVKATRSTGDVMGSWVVTNPPGPFTSTRGLLVGAPKGYGSNLWASWKLWTREPITVQNRQGRSAGKERITRTLQARVSKHFEAIYLPPPLAVELYVYTSTPAQDAGIRELAAIAPPTNGWATATTGILGPFDDGEAVATALALRGPTRFAKISDVPDISESSPYFSIL